MGQKKNQNNFNNYIKTFKTAKSSDFTHTSLNSNYVKIKGAPLTSLEYEKKRLEEDIKILIQDEYKRLCSIIANKYSKTILDGEINERERSLLVTLATAFGIDEQRTSYLEEKFDKDQTINEIELST